MALAPTWFASGILLGPLCALYLLVPEKKDTRTRDSRAGSEEPAIEDKKDKNHSLAGEEQFVTSWKRCWLRKGAVVLCPFLGTALFLAVSLPRTADQIMHTSHYGSKTALESFKPVTGLEWTMRSVVENLLGGAVGENLLKRGFGVTEKKLSPWMILLIWLVLGEVATLGWWASPSGRRLMLLGLGTILCSYVLVYGARAEWGYELMRGEWWTRYHLQPQLGLTFVVIGGLGRWFPNNARLTWQQAGGVLMLILVLFGLQYRPHLIEEVREGLEDYHIQVLSSSRYRHILRFPRWENVYKSQQVMLRWLEEFDAQCRERHIAAVAVRQQLDPLPIPGGYWLEEMKENGWDFLRGSDEPGPSPSLEELIRLIQTIPVPSR